MHIDRASRDSEIGELSEEESGEGDEAAADPTYVVPQGHGRFAIRYSRLATALGNLP